MRATLALLFVLLAACGTTPKGPTPIRIPESQRPASTAAFRLDNPKVANEILIFALSLLDTGYKFGGRNPEAGLDCSGMVSYVVEQTAGKRLPHNAAQIAAITQSVDTSKLQPADLVFFNTNGKPFSHMGIYLGDGKFIHAPSSRGSVRIERLDSSYFAPRFHAARSLF